MKKVLLIITLLCVVIASNSYNYPARMIEYGLHSYIRCELIPFTTDIDLYSCRNLLYNISLLVYTVYLGEFVIPKGATYCLNRNGESVSDSLMYTGNYVKIALGEIYNSKELWKEK